MLISLKNLRNTSVGKKCNTVLPSDDLDFSVEADFDDLGGFAGGLCLDPPAAQHR